MRQYYYLISSLPMLEFNMKMPFTYNDFILQCEEQLEGSDLAAIKRSSISPPESCDERSSMLRKWKTFDMCLRNELARHRSSKLSKDPSKHIRGEECSDLFISSFARWAVNEDLSIETELAIDRIRWQKIEELKQGHYFDIDNLIAYALQLQILERWQRINSGNGMGILEELMEKQA